MTPTACASRLQRFWFLLALALSALVPDTARALEFGSGALPIAFEPDAPFALEPGSRIVISGSIAGTTPATVVLRIDDGQSHDYDSRMNDERVLAPGPFTLSFDTAALHTANGRSLDVTDIRRLVLFVDGAGEGVISAFRSIVPAAPPPPVVSPAAAASGAPHGGAGTGITFGSGPLPITVEPSAPLALDPSDRIDVAGTVDGPAPAMVVLRIDDGASTNYASRMNIERTLGPGPFAMSFDVADLRANDGRKLDPSDIRRIILFINGPGTAQAWHFGLSHGTAIGARAAASTNGDMEIGAGPLPVAFEPNKAVALPAGGHIDIEGLLQGPGPSDVVLRIDDARSTDYGSRVNEQKTLPPGPFRLNFDIARLRTSNGRALDATAIVRMILFVNGAGNGQVTRFVVTPPPSRRGDAAGVVPVADPPRPKAAAAPVLANPAAQAAEMRQPPARLFGLGRLPLKFDAPLAATAGDEIVVEGVVHDASPAAVALRIDDAASSNYSTRFNDERRIPPGPFRFAVGVRGLKTPSGRTLDVASLSRVVLFAWEGKPNVTISRFGLSHGAALPPGAHGYSFGATDAALLSGFERIGPTDSRIVARGAVQIVRRPAPDPLIANGLRNVRRIALPAPSGRVRVTVWSEDPGEWELLPHPFERRIQVNGRDLVAEKMSADQWIATRYLRGANIEQGTGDDAWTAYGARRGNAAAIDLDAAPDGVVIELSGGDSSAYFINAVLIEPLATGLSGSQASPGQIFVADMRARWYRETLPVAPPLPRDGRAQISLASTIAAPGEPQRLKTRIAPDSGASLLFDLVSDADIPHPKIVVEAPRKGAIALGVHLWAAQVRLERDASVLRLGDDRLLADTSALGLTKNVPRGYELWLDVPARTPPGPYTGAVTVATGSHTRTLAIDIEVLAVTLPQAGKPAGFYLARAAHLNYFPGLTLERERQIGCDLELLAGFGLTNTAPPIGGLDRTDLGLFAADMRRAQAAGVAPGWLIYNPLDALVAGQGLARAADTVRRAEEVIRAQALPEPLWSVADEPSNPDQAGGHLAEWVRLLRAKSAHIRLGAHLNTPKDEAVAGLFDTLIVNAGFGIDAGRLQTLHAGGKHLWLYNTFAPRLTAGLWLWRTAAERYVQWHARMPTADPFDPTDGREADFQVIYPSAEVCPRQPDIHRDLLRMAEGVVDQRWLAWLDAQSKPEARRLRETLMTEAPDSFAAARALSRAQLERMRGRIIDLVGK